MEKVLGDLHLDLCFIYLHSLIVFSITYEEHLDKIRIVLHRLRESGLKFHQWNVRYIASKDGIDRINIVLHRLRESG